MPTKPPAPVTLTATRGGRGRAFRAVYVERSYRFLLSDGSTVDVLASRDDSDLRRAVLDTTGVESIVGVVELASDDA